jgi:hypothetical protein
VTLPEQDLDDLAAALAHVGARVDQVGRPAPDSLLVRPGPGAPAVVVRVRGLSRGDPARVARLLAEAAGPGRSAPVTVLVADLVSDRGRELLRAAGWGWLDRRGTLRIQGPGLLIDAPVPATGRPPVSVRPPISGRSGITWAAALLLDPGRSPVLREVSRRAGMAPSSLSAAAAPVREAGLVDGQGRARLPDLFWALADAWRPAWIPVGALPSRPGGQDARAAVVLGGAAAALIHGAPAGPEWEERADLYVETPAEVARLARECGRCHPDLGVARLAVAPTALVATTAAPDSRSPGGWPVVHRLFAALDLVDRPGGAGALARWQPEWIT